MKKLKYFIKNPDSAARKEEKKNTENNAETFVPKFAGISEVKSFPFKLNFSWDFVLETHFGIAILFLLSSWMKSSSQVSKI